MAARYGHRWTSQFAVSEGADVAKVLDAVYADWCELLAGLTRADMLRGLRADAQRGDDWPPAAPAFAAMCRGIPSLAAVKYDLSHRMVNGFTRLVWSFIDGYVFGRTDNKHAERLIADAYELARKHVMRGGALPQPSEALPAPAPEERTPATPETVSAHMAEIDRLLRGEDAEEAA